MNDALLSQRLRELREPPPPSGFEQRLRAALSREAFGLAASAPAERVWPRRVRPWRVRAAVTLVVAFGASAAAAAAGWVSWPWRGEAGDSSTGTTEEKSAEQRQPALPRRGSLLEVERPALAEVAPAAPPPPASEKPVYVDSARPASSPGAASGASEARAKRSLTAPPVIVEQPERRARSAQEPSPLKPRSEASPAIVPFELPGVDLSGAASEAPPAPGAERDDRSDRRTPRAGRRRVDRPRPQLERGPPDRSERGVSETMRERGHAREPRGRDNAERGLDRAREARERNGK